MDINLTDYNVVILNDCNLDLHIKVNNFCRENNIKFISTSCVGLTARYFCDFG